MDPGPAPLGDIGQPDSEKPFRQTIMVSPGSRTLAQAASIAPVPVADSGTVRKLLVRKTWRSMAPTSSIICKKTGSRWPTTGLVIACSTRGWTELGPGPIRMRWGGIDSVK